MRKVLRSEPAGWKSAVGDAGADTGKSRRRQGRPQSWDPEKKKKNELGKEELIEQGLCREPSRAGGGLKRWAQAAVARSPRVTAQVACRTRPRRCGAPYLTQTQNPGLGWKFNT